MSPFSISVRRVFPRTAAKFLLLRAVLSVPVFLVPTAATFAAAAPADTGAKAGAEAASDALQSWITTNAIHVRSIDAEDENFSDLEPLMDAIGTARVVQLGEPGHGAGSSFAAKVRLIKFLHQRMGFDVVLWESGMHGLRHTQAGMRAGGDAMGAAQRGVFALWSGAEEVRPLFEYAKASQAGVRPLEMAGFDLQFTAEGAAERFAADLRSFARAVREPALRDRALALIDGATTAHDQIFARDGIRQRKNVDAAKAGKAGDEIAQVIAAWEAEDATAFRQTFKMLNEAANDLLDLMRNQRGEFERVHGTQEIAWMEHAIENLRASGAIHFGRTGPDRPVGVAAFAPRAELENRRDARNADNLRWLIEKVYAGRKVVIWAHNAHVMNAYYDASDWRSVYLSPREPCMKPSGVFLADWLKADVYTILMTAYEGTDRWSVVDNPTSIAPAAEGSLEARLHRLGQAHIFLDFRSVRGISRHPLHAPLSMRIPKYDANTLSGLEQICDAVFYIDHMSPATRLRAANETTTGTTGEAKE